MSDIIDLLERLGRDSDLRYASETELEDALKQSNLSGVARAAILAKDDRTLESLLGGRANVCCMVASPLKEEDDEEQQQSEQKKDAPKPEKASGDEFQDRPQRNVA